MHTILSFDVEIWCNGWARLDDEFPRAFERYVYGESRENGGALPATLDILDRYGIHGVFFVEPLFSARFGRKHLEEIVNLIGERGHEIQLHLHTEWLDEIRPRPLPHLGGKRQHLRQLELGDQISAIRLGLEMLRDAGVRDIRAFRAGNYGANADTFRALAACGLEIDSSINPIVADSVPDLRGLAELYGPSRIEGVLALPITVFRDGLGRERPAQVGACSSTELMQALGNAAANDSPLFMLVSHSFEMLRTSSSAIDGIVSRRFERLCRFLAENADTLYPSVLAGVEIALPSRAPELPRVQPAATLWRQAEQLVRRASLF